MTHQTIGLYYVVHPELILVEKNIVYDGIDRRCIEILSSSFGKRKELKVLLMIDCIVCN